MAVEMTRYSLHIKKRQLDALNKLADVKEEKVSRLIRDAIDLYLNKA